MEFKMFVKLMIVVIPLFGAVSSIKLKVGYHVCPEMINLSCACHGKEKAKIVPIRMCPSGKGCIPCPMDIQDQIDCSVCPGNICPVCSENETSLQATKKNRGSYVMSWLERPAREARGWELIPAIEPLPEYDSWCVFDRVKLKGDVKCTFTNLAIKQCVLSCAEDSLVGGKRELSFRCTKKENVWKPEIQPCVEIANWETGIKPEIPKKSEELDHTIQKVPELKEKSGYDPSDSLFWGDLGDDDNSNDDGKHF